MLVNQRIVNTEIPILPIGPVDSNLRLFRMAWVCSWDDFLDSFPPG
jgi:hypothetical protein